MFVVWRRNVIRSRGPETASRRHDHHAMCSHTGEEDRVVLVPVLVRSRRVDGKPRQEFVERFPSIRSCCIADPIARAAWWDALEGRFAWYREIVTTDCSSPWFSEDAAAEVIARLAEKVPLPTEEEREAFRRRRDERERQLDEKCAQIKSSFARA
jgi:hypothetical protein